MKSLKLYCKKIKLKKSRQLTDDYIFSESNKISGYTKKY